MENPKRIARTVELVAGVGGEVEAEVAVVVEDRGVNGAIEEGKDGIRGRWD